MTKENIRIQFFIILGLFLLLPIAVIPSRGDIIPVVPLNTQANTFAPTVSGNSSYYLVQPGFNGSNLYYSGRNSDFTYTTNGGTSFGTGSDSFTNGQTVPSSAVSTGANSVDNPFFKPESIPSFVNISTTDAKLLSLNAIPLSLHMGQSMTFFFNQTLHYYALINTSNAFFLDVNVINPSAKINIDLSNTLYPQNKSYVLFKKLSIPIMPKEPGLQAFEISNGNNQNSIVTITPLPFNPSSFGQEQIDQGSYYSGAITQGSCVDIQNHPAYDNNLELMDLKFFQLPIKAGNTYQIYFYQSNIYDNYDQLFSRCQIGSLNAVNIDFPSSFNYKGGSLKDNTNGLILNAKTDGFANITLIASGLVAQDFGLYFVENNQFLLPKNVPLTFNTPIELKDSPNTYYTFNLTQPSLLAINYTNTIDLSKVHFDWSQYNTSSNDYSSMTNSKFNAESGNLVDSTAGHLGVDKSGHYNWIYLPEGNYKFNETGAQSQIGKFQFNLVPIKTFTTNTTLNINSKSIVAVELPLNRIDYNYINASTIAQDNVSVRYEYAIIGKYSLPNINNFYDAVQYASGTFRIGNREVNGNWTGYNFNKTSPLETYVKPTQSDFVPIMLIRPYNATAYNNNNTEYVSSNYTTTLTISSTTGRNNYPNGNFAGNSYLIGDGRQIAIPGQITTQQTFPINDNQTVTSRQNMVYAFNLVTTPNQLYNVTVFLNGNYSTGANFLNATFDGTHVWVHSGNFLDTTVFGNKFFRETNTSAISSQEFLSLSSQSYLFVDIVRNQNATTGTYENATLQVVLSPVTVKTLDLYSAVQKFSWNQTVSNYEVVDTKPLWNITNYSYPGSAGGSDLIVPIAIATGAVVIVAVAGGTIFYVRKKRNS